MVLGPFTTSSQKMDQACSVGSGAQTEPKNDELNIANHCITTD